MQNDWNNYRKFFPKRYFEKGFFDVYIEKMLEKIKGKQILDIGGGAFGTEVLNNGANDVYLLDPNIKKKPEWMKGQVDWTTNEKYDLIVARGSVNYLSPEEISRIPLMLKHKGIFIANTFQEKPSTDKRERFVENASGEQGVESVLSQGSIIFHELKFANYEIKHNFYYYSLDEYSKMLSYIQFIPYNNNSVIMIYYNL